MKCGMYIPLWDIKMGTWGQLLPPDNTPCTSNYAKLWLRDIDFSRIDFALAFVYSITASGYIEYSNADVAADVKKPLSYYIHTTHNKPVLFSVGGAFSNTKWYTAMANRYEDFLNELLYIYDTYDYDGIDLDIEPIYAADETLLIQFITDLYTRLQQRTSAYTSTGKPLLITANWWSPEIWYKCESMLDYIFIMTYDLGGYWFGKMWHCNPIYNSVGDIVNETDNEIYDSPMTAIQTGVQRWTAAGWPRNKLLVGMAYYGYRWYNTPQYDNTAEGCIAPRQRFYTAIAGTPRASDVHYTANYSYLNITNKIASGLVPQWDSSAHASYLSNNASGLANDEFISYTSERQIEDIVTYAHNEGLAGVFAYEISIGALTYGTVPQQPLAIATTNALNMLDTLSNVFTAKAKELILSGTFNWQEDTFKIALLDTRYTHVNARIETYQFLGDFPTGVVHTISEALTNKTNTNRILTCDDLTITVSGLHWIHKAVIFQDTGDATTSPIIVSLNNIDGLPYKTSRTAAIPFIWPDTGIIKL